MNLTGPEWVAIVAGILSVGTVAERILQRWTAPPVQPPAPTPPAPPVLLHQPPMMVAPPSPPILPPAPVGSYRGLHDSGGDCMGCASMRDDLNRMRDEMDKDRQARQRIQTTLDKMAGAREERDRLRLQSGGGRTGGHSESGS
jgi:type IV secretory pathway VirB10-like protein